jgi:hypothetical protein
MSNLKKDEYKRSVREALTKLGVAWQEGEIYNKCRKTPLLNQDLFFDLSRFPPSKSYWKHTPDIFISSENVPCETKSPGEIYGFCRSSRAHLCSYLLQMIYGQCSSYADLFRLTDDQLHSYLIYPQSIILEKKDSEIVNIEDVFRKIIENNCQLYLDEMNLHSIDFEAPNFPNSVNCDKYVKFENGIQFLATKIKFKPNNSVQSTARA